MRKQNVSLTVSLAFVQTMQERKVLFHCFKLHFDALYSGIKARYLLKYLQLVMCGYTINNIKVSFKACSPHIQRSLKEICASSAYVTKKDINFFVLRKKFVFIVFFKGHINCTKLKSVDDLSQCLIEFEDFFPSHERGKLKLQAPIIDNISASGSLMSPRVNLLNLAKFLREEELHFRFNPETFPGLCFRVQPVSFTIFTSGKFIAVGAQKHVDLSISIDIFRRYLDKFLKKDESNGN